MAVRDAGTRQDTWAIRISLDGKSLGIWDKKDGGEVDSDTQKYRPGAMRSEISLGGTRTTGNLTVSRIYDRIDDHAHIANLLNRAGRGRVTVSQRPMDQDGNEYGKSIIWDGILKRVTVPPTDSESGSAAMLEVEIEPIGVPAVA